MINTEWATTSGLGWVARGPGAVKRNPAQSQLHWTWKRQWFSNSEMHLNHVGSWGLTLPEHRLLSHIPGGSDSAGLGRWRGEAVRFAFLTSSQVILGTHIENHWFRRLVAPRRKHNPGLFFFLLPWSLHSNKDLLSSPQCVVNAWKSTEVKMWNYTENGMRYQLHACGIWSCQHLHGRHIVTAALRCSYLCFWEWNGMNV